MTLSVKKTLPVLISFEARPLALICWIASNFLSPIASKFVSVLILNTFSFSRKVASTLLRIFDFEFMVSLSNAPLRSLWFAPAVVLRSARATLVMLMPVVFAWVLPKVPGELKFTVISLALGAMMPMPSFACILSVFTQSPAIFCAYTFLPIFTVTFSLSSADTYAVTLLLRPGMVGFMIASPTGFLGSMVFSTLMFSR